MYTLNQPVWVLSEPGYFECYVNPRDSSEGARIGVRPGFSVVVPLEWVRTRKVHFLARVLHALARY